jgi:hypothetical protein
MKPRILRVEKVARLLINDAQYIERAEIIREKGDKPQSFLPWAGR